MVARLIAWAVERRGMMLALTLVISAFGVWSFTQQPIDAFPDISAQRVLIITTFRGRAPEEIERQVTIPIELAMGSTPQVSVIRSRTIFGLSTVELIFDEGTDGYFARQRVQERLATIVLPEGVVPELGPLATAYGEILRYEIKSDGAHDLKELRTINDWVVTTRLQRTPGVAEVVNFGGFEKQYTLKLDPRQIERFGLNLTDIVSAVQANNSNAGGSVMRRGEMSFVIRGRGSLVDIRDIESTVVNTVAGTPVYLRDVAFVELDGRLPSGIFGKDLTDQSVEGIVLMRRGENPSQVLARVKAEVDELNAESMPAGTKIVPFYDRQFLVNSTLDTVMHSVFTGIALVLMVLLAFLGSPSMALLVGLTVPFALLFALSLMYLTNIPIGLLSIGAIDFGILVDGAVVMAHSIGQQVASLRARQQESETNGSLSAESATIPKQILRAATAVERPIFFSMLIIICAYVPLLTLQSIEGLLFRPMALTVIFALVGAVLFGLLILPGLATILLRKGYQDLESPMLVWFRPIYARIIDTLMRMRWGVVTLFVLVFFAVTGTVVPRLGFDFLPYLDEGVIWVRANFPEGTSLETTSLFANEMRELIREIPDVTYVASQAGRNDSGTDPFTPSRLEMMIGLKPMNEWESASKQELLRELGARLRTTFPTVRFNFTQPIIDSVTEDTNGTSANLALEFSGTDSEVLRSLGEKAVTLLKGVRGAVDVNVEQEGPQPQLVIKPDRTLCARYDIKIDDVNRLINTALGGEPVSTLYERERRFDIVARFDRDYLTSPDMISRLPVFNRSGIPFPLAQIAKIELVDGETFIARDSGRRRVTVRCDIVGRDQGGFVAEAKRAYAATLKAPDGYRVRWIGMFENLERASKHFMIVIPVTIGMIYSLLVLTFNSHRNALLVLSAVPFAFIGGVLALYLRGMTLNVSSGVGFAALFGVAIMDGVLLVETIAELRKHGMPFEAAIKKAAMERLRPSLIASSVAILGLVPASLARGLGSDVQRPLATVIVWGLMSSMILNLFVLPILYRTFAVDHAMEPKAE